MYDVRENEHQELFHFGINPLQPVPIQIPSPLGRLGYYLYVRAPAAAVERLECVSAQVDVGGLREDHVTLAPGEGAPERVTVPSKEPGLAWRCLGRAPVSRGNGTVIFQGWPADVGRADLLLCTWPRFVESGMADDRIAAQADPRWAPSGVPLGGIGGGRVDICRDGRFRNFSMNDNQDAPLEDPDGLAGAYLALAAEEQIRDLASRPIVSGRQACDRLEYLPRFPQAVLRAPDIFPGLDATVTLSGTVCPHDLRRSSIPGFLVRWEVTNRGAKERTVRCLLGWPNLIGVGGCIAKAESGIGYGDGFYHYWDDPTGRAEAPADREGYAAVRYSGAPAAQFLASSGEHLLGVRRDEGVTAEVTCGQCCGEACGEVVVPAGGRAIITMAVVAAMPHWVDSLGADRGAYWQNHFADGAAMLAALLEEADDTLREAGALAALLADSTLPAWLQRRLCNCNYPLVTNSVFYRDGRFSVNEGPTEMAGCYGTMDQRLCAHPATQLLFPELNATELGLFAQTQAPNGGINHDLGGGHLERPAGELSWPDLTCSFIIQTARHAWSTGDAAFAAAMWPCARRALLRHAEWAQAGGGVAQVGSGLGTSYDGYHYLGTTGYMATLWLAALAVCERWARREGDNGLLRDIPRWREEAIRRLNADLWNGRRFLAYGNSAGLRRETCHAGQLAGQVFARLLCGVDILPEDQLRSCADAMLTLNGSARFRMPPDEVSPDGEAAADFSWLPYVEGFMLTAAAALGDGRLWPLWERMMAAVEDDGARPCDTRLMYRPLNGEPSWGAYYMTAPASWLVYDAALGFFYDAEEGLLRLHPTMPGRFPLVHPLFWGTLDTGADGAGTLTVRRVPNAIGAPRSIRFLALPAGARQVTIDGGTVTDGEEDGRFRRYPLAQPFALREGAVLAWQIA